MKYPALTIMAPRLIPACILAIIAVSYPLSPVMGSQQERHRYLIREGNEEYVNVWELEHKNGVIIRSAQKDELYVTTCSESGETRMIEVTSSTEHVRAWRTGNTLYVRGTIDGKKIDRRFRVDEAPWYQPLTYSLRGFLSTDKKQVDFWMLHPDTYKPYKIQATKEDTGTINLYGRKTRVQHIRIRISGILYMLWHGDYWYRTGDRVLVEYRGLNGPPGSSQTIVKLMKTGG